MGIDPNNHRLSQNLPRSQNSGSATSSGSKSQGEKAVEKVEKIEKPKPIDKEQVSEAGSCLDGAPCVLPDLNLDLTMNIASTFSANIQERQKDKIDHQSNLSRGIDLASTPTLLLFH